MTGTIRVLDDKESVHLSARDHQVELGLDVITVSSGRERNCSLVAKRIRSPAISAS
ncbi:MAG: hypothetical protein ABSG98_02095 [Anaerolineales bacterium]|jgi:hypothetical protein